MLRRDRKWSVYVYVLCPSEWINSPGFEKAGSDFDFKKTWVPGSSSGFGKKDC